MQVDVLVVVKGSRGHTIVTGVGVELNPDWLVPQRLEVVAVPLGPLRDGHVGRSHLQGDKKLAR